MDAKPAPAQQKFAQRKASGRERQARHCADAARELERAGEERTEEGERPAGAKRELARERVRKAQRAERRDQRRKEDHICADLQYCLPCGGDRAAERRAKVRRPPRRFDRSFAAARPPAEENADSGGGDGVDAPEQHPPPGGAEHSHAKRAHGERRAGIIAEGEQMLGFVLSEQTIPIKRPNACRPERVSAGETEQEHCRARAAHAEELRGGRGETARERVHRAEPREQSRRGKVRQERRHEKRSPQPESVGGALPGVGRGEEKEKKERRACGVSEKASFHHIATLCPCRTVHAACTSCRAHRMTGKGAGL